MKECWLSPYGELIYTGGEWEHANKAASIIFDRYNNGKYQDTNDVWCESMTKTPTDILEELGWVRFSTISNSWVVIDGYTRLTEEQKIRIFELTGDNFE